jgi:large subunit ribosomal protein L17
MRHRRKGRVLGRSPSHQRALLRNLASALMLTEQEVEAGEPGAAKVKGRIVTTLPKAKEVRPLVERCITVARRGLAAAARAEGHRGLEGVAGQPAVA